jgi:hypothetical protein
MKVFLLLTLALGACTSSELPTVAPSPTASTRVTPVARSAAESTACARAVLTSFIDAFNGGDSAQLMTHFSTNRGTAPFKWFVTPATAAFGPSLAELPRYFATWNTEGERWRLVNVYAGASPSWHGGVDFAMEIERAWPDRTTLNGGKGALDCDARTIFVFALGDPLR